MSSTIRLGVNIDHVATLRQLRAGTVDYPDVVKAAKDAMLAGADQITLHLRGDRRHIQEDDLKKICALKNIPVNLEMAADSGMLKRALKYRPHAVCLVPEKRQEVTTEGGLDVIKNKLKIKKCIEPLKKVGIRVSLFIEPELKQVEMSYKLGANAVEFHTGKYALTHGAAKLSELKRLKKSFEAAKNLGLEVHAGHGLNLENVGDVAKLAFVEELNIGHSIICRAVEVGLCAAVKEMKNAIYFGVSPQ